MIPSINSMIAAGIVFIPGIMTGQILAGADPLQAHPLPDCRRGHASGINGDQHAARGLSGAKIMLRPG